MMPKSSMALWTLAAASALALHLGGAVVAMSYANVEPSDEEDGAPAIEIGLEMASLKNEPSDLPPGPEAEASAASQAMQEQKVQTEVTELAKGDPTETEDPDRVVAPQATEKPKEEEPQTTAVPTTQSSESVASEATAAPTIEEAPPSEKSVAPVIGTGRSLQRIRATWQRQLVAHIDRHKRYPSGGARRSVEVVVQFELDRLGHVKTVAIARGSGDVTFDEAAVAMMRRSDPVPPPPPLVADEGLSFTMPIVFRTKG